MRKRKIAATSMLIAALSVAVAIPTPLHHPIAAHATCYPSVSWPGYGPYEIYSGGTSYIAADFNYSCFTGQQQLGGVFYNESSGANYTVYSPIFNGSGSWTATKSYVTTGVKWDVHACVSVSGGAGPCTSIMSITTT